VDLGGTIQLGKRVVQQGFVSVNGVVRAIRVNNSNQANGARCSSRYSGSQGHSWVNSDVGFL